MANQDASSRLTDRPVLLLISSHWVSMLGAALLGTALISWLFVLPFSSARPERNPYVGIVVFLIIPAIFFLGLALVPVGMLLAKRRIRNRMETHVTDPRAARRKLVGFLGAVTLINVVAGTQFTYHAVEHMESVEFCGQSCHVMRPEFMAHQNSPHARVECVGCHVEPGAQGWLKSKMDGTRQLVEVALNSHPRPIPSALEANRLVPAKETCEQCHWAERFAAVRLKVIAHFADDEANSETQTALMMLIGGSKMHGIHGAHFGPGVEIRFAAADAKRQTIPWVEYKNSETQETRAYLASKSTQESVGALPVHTMQCVDCHNRPTHAFELPERAVDRRMMIGELPATLPYVRKQGIALLKAAYSSSEEAEQKIPAGLADYYKTAYPDVSASRAADITQAGRALADIYGRNVFPDLKVDWGTYPDNIGHMDFPGCFRCHDEDHAAADGKKITQDCSACHNPLAIEEASPQVMKTLGLDEALVALKKGSALK